VVKITIVETIALETDALSSQIKQFQRGGKYPVVVVVDVEVCSLQHPQQRPYPESIKVVDVASADSSAVAVVDVASANSSAVYVLCGMVYYEDTPHFAAELYKPGISFVYDSMSNTFAGKDFVMAERLQTECQQSGEKQPSLLIYAQVNAC
jgi:hypothetical protein